jgi:hypothetical protein
VSGSCGISFRSVWRQSYCRCNIGARFAPNVPLAQKSFWMHLMILLGDEAQVEVCLSRLEIVLILTQDRCTVCAKRTIGSEIVLNAPDGSPR